MMSNLKPLLLFWETQEAPWTRLWGPDSDPSSPQPKEGSQATPQTSQPYLKSE